ncbi:MAG: class I SAM-dependent methyltransferase [Spirochaetes bacterium]|nr:class I SAM-dependent methyltransferase [Spirochaetota bacterium]
MADYDSYYQTEDLFGKPYAELLDFFSNFAQRGSLLDLGCGQGRDSIPLARLGYTVSGIDNSKVGIAQMIEKAGIEKLPLTGLVTDLYAFDRYQDFDIVLLDSMLHFEKRDMKREMELLDRIANEIKAGGILCICIQDTGKKVKILKETINNTGLAFEILNDSSLTYVYEDKESGHSSKTRYCMYILKKQ